ncbi:MAG: 7-cyano-7-deazaguanine synthase [Chloroflexi bacterium]|nr:7-cyano-7-deazaguanine synthase [Chloroflexota bacterium]
MPTIERVALLRVTAEVSARNMYIHYEMDQKFRGALRIGFPFDLTEYKSSAEYIFGIWGGIFLAQLCLAESVVLENTYDDEAWASMDTVTRNLYDIRSYRDQLDFLDMPKVYGTRPPKTDPCSIANEKRACLLWSGGTDSTLALNLLHKNDYDIVPIHVKINTGAVDGELAAVQLMSDLLQIDLQIVEYEFEEYLQIAKTYSNVIDIYPHNNPVPHGRELILVPIAVMFSLKYNAPYICLGHENNAWTRVIEYKGRKIYRCDTQSQPSNVAMQNFIRSYLQSPIRIFSAVAPLSDFLKFKLLSSIEPSLLASTNACFWGDWCGECSKCSLYYMLQRMLGIDQVKFKRNPLQSSAILKRIVDEWQDETQTNWSEYQLAFHDIVKQGYYSSDDQLIVKYKELVYPHMQSRIPAIRERLTKIHSVELMPDGFVIK